MPSAKMPLYHQEVVKVPLTENERDSQTISDEHLGAAISALHRDGIVVLENAVDLDHVDKLNTILSDEADIMAKLPTTHFNDLIFSTYENSIDGRPTGNMSQAPPLDPTLMYTDIWANGPAAAVLQCVLGPKPIVNYVNGNTALGGFHGSRQAVHADLSFNHAQFPFAIVTNYYLMDVSPANGSTELWVASHRDTTFADHRNCDVDAYRTNGPGLQVVRGQEGMKEFKFGIREELLEQRREYAPPIQPTVKRGSVVLRDLRLWHAGLCNPSPDPRIMLAFVHTPHWYGCPGKVVLPEAARPLVSKWASQQYPVRYNAHFVPSDVDHKAIKFSPSFNGKNKGYISQLPDLPSGFLFDDFEEAE